jgi:alpha-beta hydrolase superfamily lysophospholipase
MRFDLPGGDSLVVRVWSTPTPRHIVLGVHGFNDYSKAFESLAQHLAGKLGATVYAYDQRGFGANPEPGVWPGSDALLAELRHIVVQLRQRHPGLPLTVMGAAPLAAAKCVTPTAKRTAGPGVGVRQTPVTYF